jgi:hypothetical protein
MYTSSGHAAAPTDLCRYQVSRGVGACGCRHALGDGARSGDGARLERARELVHAREPAHAGIALGLREAVEAHEVREVLLDRAREVRDAHAVARGEERGQAVVHEAREAGAARRGRRAPVRGRVRRLHRCDGDRGLAPRDVEVDVEDEDLAPQQHGVALAERLHPDRLRPALERADGPVRHARRDVRAERARVAVLPERAEHALHGVRAGVVRALELCALAERGHELRVRDGVQRGRDRVRGGDERAQAVRERRVGAERVRARGVLRVEGEERDEGLVHRRRQSGSLGSHGAARAWPPSTLSTECQALRLHSSTRL